jgi:hypothetical protein
MTGNKPDNLPGRNQPCWCGSGKKYKFCHLRQDQAEARAERQAMSSTPSGPFPVPAEPSPVSPEIEAANARWERFQAVDLETKVVIFQETLDAGELDEEEAYEMLSSIRAELDTASSPQDRTRYAALVDQLRRKAPDLYRHDAVYYHESLIRDAVADGRWEALSDLLAPFVEMPDRGIDIFFRLVDLFRYHGQMAPLIQAMQQAWPKVVDSSEILPWGVEEFGVELSVLLLFEYLETAGAPRSDDPALLEACAPYAEFEAAWLDNAVRYLSAPAPTAWKPADFTETVDADQWEDNLNALLFEFVADRHRQGVPLARADMPRGSLFSLLREQLVKMPEQRHRRSGRRRRGRKRAERQPTAPSPPSLVPRYAPLEKTLVGMFGFLSAEPYKAGALIESIPPYLHFLTRLGLIHPTRMDGALSSLRPLANQLVTLLENYGADPRLIENVQAALRDDPALAEARAAPLVVVEPPPPPVRRPGALQTYIFKATYLRDPDIWRKIEISEDQTLDDLHHAVRRSVAFDDDHLYSFFLSGRAWDRDTEFTSPRSGKGRGAADVKIGDLSLRRKQRFLYLFDYGDEHHFEVQLMDATQDVRYPRVVESHGQEPSQYGREEDWDEDWDDEDWEDEDWENEDL